VGSDEYADECALRDAVLRKPLGLSLRDEDLEGEKDQSHFGLFDASGHLVACVIAAPLSSTEARIRQMAVSPGRRGEGLGRRLMAELERTLCARGFRRFVLAARTSAAGFYEKLGYAAVGAEYVDLTIPHVEMTKSLPGDASTAIRNSSGDPLS